MNERREVPDSARGKGDVGLAHVLFLAGARSLVLSLWKVGDDTTARLMTRFYQNQLGQREGLQHPMPKALALDEPKRWLRSLSPEEIERQTQALPRQERVGKTTAQARPPAKHTRRYAHPNYWSAFILIGDPN